MLLNISAAGLATAARPELSIDRAASNVLIHFSGTLQSADRAEGPYRTIAGAANHYLASSTNSQRFWRALLPGVRTFAAGGGHTLALRADGTLWAWGNNYYGQLGDGTFTNASIPTQIGTNTNWQAVAAGGAHTVALRADGTLWVWGDNLFGQLGNATQARSTNTPQQIGTNAAWQAVAAGGYHTVALRADGTLWAWGYNDRGQIGNGAWLLSTNSPQQVGTNTTWQTISAGGSCTVALRTNGTLWAWGDNRSGQLGNGTFISTNTPQPIATNATWQVVSTGGDHTVALRADGTLWGWGEDGASWSGFRHGTIMRTNTPQQIGTNATWQTVAAGGAHTVALRADGTLWTWGNNDAGQLGNGTLIGTNTPALFGTNATWQAVAAGGAHIVALRADGTLWAWGRYEEGQLGDGTLTGVNTPQPIATNATWQAVAGGGDHTVALRADGTLWAWGYNKYGQCGNGTSVVCTNTPQPVGTNATWQAVAAGYDHSIALRADGTLWVWGINYSGQLGDGTFTNASIPKQIGTNLTWQAVAAGGSHTVASRADGTLWAWGDNGAGQLGNGTLMSTNTPQQVGTNAVWRAVAAGGSPGLGGHTVGLQADGTLWAWGNNGSGQLGNGTLTSTNSPQQVGTNATWQAVAAGGYHTLALRVDGTLWAWGYNPFGQVGQPVPWWPDPVLGGAVWGLP